MDRDLVVRARAGDRDAFSQLATASIGRLNAVARLIVRDEGRAEDAVQDALVDAWLDLRGLRDPDRFDARLNRLVVHACQDVARRASRRMEAEMAPRGAASAVAAATGKLAGGLITLGVAGVRAFIQAFDRPDSEALIRRSLGNTFDKAWTKLVQSPTSGVMACTLYMAAQIEGSLGGSAQPPVGLSTGTVDRTPAQPTNLQHTP